MSATCNKKSQRLGWQDEGKAMSALWLKIPWLGIWCVVVWVLITLPISHATGRYLIDGVPHGWLVIKAFHHNGKQPVSQHEMASFQLSASGCLPVVHSVSWSGRLAINPAPDAG